MRVAHPRWAHGESAALRTCLEQVYPFQSEYPLPKVQGRWQAVCSCYLVVLEGTLTSVYPGPTVSEIGKAPLQRALQVTVPHFLDWSGGVLQPTR